MNILRLGPIGHEIPVVRVDGTDFDLRTITVDIDPAFFAADGLARVRAALDAGELSPLDGAAELRIGSPVARPGSILGIGLNYAAHAAESGLDAPASPVVFFKMPSTVTGPHDALELPPYATKADWEVELGFVVGSRAFRVASAEEGLAHIAGYLLANDYSERHFQIEASGGQWGKGKNLPGFAPLGPWLTPAAEVDPASLGIRSWVNGEVRQDSHTSDLIFGVGEIVRELSQVMALEPGDVVLTGTPAGVALSGKFPYLVDGDTVEIEIDGLGRQKQDVVVTE